MTINDLLNRHSVQAPGRPAVITPDGTINYRHLEEQSNQLAARLWHLGIRPGHRVGVLMHNCIENIILCFALFKIRAVEVSLIPDSFASVGPYLINSLSLQAIITHRSQDILIETVGIDQIPCTVYRYEKLEAGGNFDTVPDQDYSLSDDALILFTSGTTGIPKGCVLSHENILCAARVHNEFIEVDSSMRLLNILPLHHSCGRSMLLECIAAGATMVLGKKFTSPLKLLKIIQQQRITHITAPPFIFHYLNKLKNNEKILEQLKTHLNVFEIGLSTISAGLIHQLQDTFPFVTIFNRYGMTENASAASLYRIPPSYSPRAIDNDQYPCGKGLKCTEINVLDNKGFPAEPGHLGEIVMRGTNVMTGYWDDLAGGKSGDYRENWFYTGDMGYKNEQGLVYVKGRNDEFVNVMGYKVFLGQLNSIISKYNGIKHAAAVGIPDPVQGSRIAVFVIPRRDNHLKKEELEAFCKKHLPPYMVPQQIIFTRTLPRTGSGKISLAALEQIAGGSQ